MVCACYFLTTLKHCPLCALLHWLLPFAIFADMCFRVALAACVAKFAQCGGNSSGGKKVGAWACCPAGYYCKQYNVGWWSCQVGKAVVAKKPVAQKPAPVPTSNARRRPTDNRRTGGGSTLKCAPHMPLTCLTLPWASTNLWVCVSHATVSKRIMS